MTEPPFPSPAAYGRSLRGFGVNLLVRDIDRALAFQREVLGTELVHRDGDFAVLRHDGVSWMLHADATFRNHPLLALASDGALRGLGVELRLYRHDPDRAEAAARRRGDPVPMPSVDKPHGLRECAIADPDGYAWVPSRPL
jgi:catechol 2,3-dioxygenase-like lactoylglutathione lyase family enzyme